MNDFRLEIIKIINKYDILLSDFNDKLISEIFQRLN